VIHVEVWMPISWAAASKAEHDSEVAELKAECFVKKKLWPKWWCFCCCKKCYAKLWCTRKISV